MLQLYNRILIPIYLLPSAQSLSLKRLIDDILYYYHYHLFLRRNGCQGEESFCLIMVGTSFYLPTLFREINLSDNAIADARGGMDEYLNRTMAADGEEPRHHLWSQVFPEAPQEISKINIWKYSSDIGNYEKYH